LLGRGNRHSVSCYKLSGTAPRHRDPLEDARQRSRFLTDAKVLNEHKLSIESTRAALDDIGAVSAGPMEVFDRRNLRHLMTPLHVAVRPDTSWSTIMRALLPSGAQPRLSGLRSLDELERISRGAYYGIIGLRTPEGDFEFSQVLRTLFRDHSGAYTFVGAAVTDGSTVDGESDETKLKLDDVMARRRVPDAIHIA
jgi:anthranilate/para-aminobenzoate synthase component I